MKYRVSIPEINRLYFIEIECATFVCTNNQFGDCLDKESKCYHYKNKEARDDLV